MVRIDCSSGGRPERAIGIAPSPIGKTSVPASRRVLVSIVVMSTTFPARWSAETAPASVPDDYVALIIGAYHRRMPQHEPDNRKRELKTQNGQKFKVKLPPGMDIKPLGATTEAKPKPAPADDPRSSFTKNAGGYAN